MCFVFHAWEFDDVMIFEYLKSYDLTNSRMKRAFEVKEKTFFFVSQVLSFRLEKQTSKNVADTTFNITFTWCINQFLLLNNFSFSLVF